MEFEEKSIPRIQYQIFYQNFEVLLLLGIFDVEDLKDSYFVEVVTDSDKTRFVLFQLCSSAEPIRIKVTAPSV